MDGEVWWAKFHGVVRSWTRLKLCANTGVLLRERKGDLTPINTEEEATGRWNQRLGYLQDEGCQGLLVTMVTIRCWKRRGEPSGEIDP